MKNVSVFAAIFFNPVAILKNGEIEVVHSFL
jgi:hypothetical protein